MISTVVSLTLAGFMLIPREAFTFHDLIELCILCTLGFWISFSMDQYKRSCWLFISEEIIAAYKGRIEVESQNNEGSLFRIILPISVCE